MKLTKKESPARASVCRREELVTETYQKAIDFSSLPSGCYYMVITNNETRIVKCIIKQ